MARIVAVAGMLYAGLLCVLVATISTVVAVAVFYRYVLNAPLVYSFDLASLLFAWLVFLGMPYAAQQRAHLRIDMVVDAMPARVAAAVELFARVAVVLCSAYLVRHGVELTLRTGLELPTMRISIAWMYAAMPVGIAHFVVLEAWSLLAWLRAGMPRRAAEVQP